MNPGQIGRQLRLKEGADVVRVVWQLGDAGAAVNAAPGDHQAVFSQAILVGDVEPEPAEVALGRRSRPHGPSGGRTLADDHRVLFAEELAFQRNEQQIRPVGVVFTMFHGGEPAHRTGEFQQEILEPAARAEQGDAAPCGPSEWRSVPRRCWRRDCPAPPRSRQSRPGRRAR